MSDRLVQELERAVESGDAEIARTIAEECTEISLSLALRLLQIAAVQDPAAYEQRALRWLARWLSESSSATLEQAAEVARALAHVPSDPSAVDAIQDLARISRSASA